jgi:hypothetical protein
MSDEAILSHLGCQNYMVEIFSKTSFICVCERCTVLKVFSCSLSFISNSVLLNPLKTQIEDFRKKIEGLSTEQVKDRSSLEQQIKNYIRP